MSTASRRYLLAPAQGLCRPRLYAQERAVVVGFARKRRAVPGTVGKYRPSVPPSSTGDDLLGTDEQIQHRARHPGRTAEVTAHAIFGDPAFDGIALSGERHHPE